MEACLTLPGGSPFKLLLQSKAARGPLHVTGANRVTVQNFKPLRLHNAVTAPCAVRRRRLLAPIASLSLGAAAAAVPPELAKTAAASALLQSSGVFILCCAGAVFLLASVPALFAIARMAHRAEAVLRQVEAELPDTAASVRLSGLELSDCRGDLGALGSNLSGGVRASARMLEATGRGVIGAPGAVKGAVVPALAKAETSARGKLRAFLVERAKTDIELLPQVRSALRSTTEAMRRARFGLAAVSFSYWVVRTGAAVRYALDVRALEVARASVAAAGAAAASGGGSGGRGGGDTAGLGGRGAGR